LNVQIYPANIPANEKNWYQIPAGYSPTINDPHPVGPSGSDFSFTYTASPFTFTITRKSTGDVVFTTKNTKLVFENQFIELKTAVPDQANIYGLGDSINANFRLGNTNRTEWAADVGYVLFSPLMFSKD